MFVQIVTLHLVTLKNIKKMRYMMIGYSIVINGVTLQCFSVHEVEETEDIYTFTHTYLMSLGLEKIFSQYFINHGQAVITITDIKIISKKAYAEILNR